MSVNVGANAIGAPKVGHAGGGHTHRAYSGQPLVWYRMMRNIQPRAHSRPVRRGLGRGRRALGRTQGVPLGNTELPKTETGGTHATAPSWRRSDGEMR